MSVLDRETFRHDAYRVTLEETATFSIERIIEFLAHHSDCRHDFAPESAAFERFLPILEQATRTLADGRFEYCVSPALLELGETRYHELLDSGYRFIYRRFVEDRTLSLYAIIHEKQDIQALLVDYCLLSL